MLRQNFYPPYPQQFLQVFGIDTQHQEHGFIDDAIALLDLQYDTVKENNEARNRSIRALS